MKTYEELFDSCVIDPDKLNEVVGITTAIYNNRIRYIYLGLKLDIPWYLIGVIHYLEGGLSWDKHLHNGDPLTARTVNVPICRPVLGEPPFAWEDSAMDALAMAGIDDVAPFTMPRMLEFLERYNGTGYRTRGENSPYLWSFSKHYISGKYIADGEYSADAVSNQCGGGVLLSRMVDALIVPGDSDVIPLERSNHVQEHGEELQRFLNKFEGIDLMEDGITGPKTSAAFSKVFGHDLRGW